MARRRALALSAIFVIISACFVNCQEEIQPQEDNSKFLSSLIHHLNHLPTQVYKYDDGVLISAQKKDGDVYDIEADINVSCDGKPCEVSVLRCHSQIRSADGAAEAEVIADKTVCRPKVAADSSTVSAEDSDAFDGADGERDPPAPVQLAHEVHLHRQYEGSGEQFVAVRRQSGGAGKWCADCPTDINVGAEGVEELARKAIQHLQRHRPQETHTLKSVLRVQRQAQIVNGIRYILLLDVNSATCEVKSQDGTCERERVANALCQVTFLEKPWLRLADGSKFRAVLANNCTEEYLFGNEGELLPPDSKRSGNGADMRNELDADSHYDSDVNVVHISELQASKPRKDEEITVQRLKDVEEQIITEESTDGERTLNVPIPLPDDSQRVQVEPLESKPIGPESQTQILTSANEQNPTAVGSDEEYVPKPLSQEKKDALDAMLGLFGFDPFDTQAPLVSVQSENQQTAETKDVSETVEEKPTPSRSRRSSDDRSTVDRLAHLAVSTLDDRDADDQKRVVLRVLNSKTFSRGNSIEYHMKIVVGLSRCLESQENSPSCLSMLTGKEKICHITADIKNTGEERVLKSECVNKITKDRRKRSNGSMTGAPINVNLEDPELMKLAQISLGKYDVTSTTSNGHVVVKLISATRQVVAGSLTKMEFEAKESECLKTDENLHSLESCKVLENAQSKICTSSIWDRPWLEDGKIITVDCQVDNRVLPGVPVKVDLKNPKLVKLAQISLGKYDLTTSTSNGHVIVNLISATTQVVAGVITKIQFEAKESGCLKTDENLHSLDFCKVLEGAESKICTSSIWDRPWLNDAREITVDCQIDNDTVQRKRNYRSKIATDNVGTPIEVNLEDPKLVKLAQISLGKYDLTTSTSNGHVVVKLISGTRQVVAGSLTKMQFEVKESECLKTDENLHSLGSCKVLEGAESMICTANVWDRPWLENGREITVDCQIENAASYKKEARSKKSGSPVVVDINDPKLMKLAHISLKQYDMTDVGTNRHVIVDFLSATKQVVSGYLTKIEFEMRESDCLKSDADVGTCKALENAESKICTTSVWERPWLEQDREITIKCTSLRRVARATDNLVGAPIQADLNDPELVKLAQISLSKYDLTSSTSNGHVVVKLISATRQVVAGSLTKMQFEAKESECLKTDENLHSLGSCKVLAAAESKICTANVWDRPWLENGREITVDCHSENVASYKKEVRSKRSGGPVVIDIKDPKLMKLAHISLKQYDMTDVGTNRHVIVDLLSATKQVVSGYLTKIEFEIRESDCLKSDTNVGTCKALENAVSKICTTSVWERPWLEQDREITIKCTSLRRDARATDNLVGAPIQADLNDPELVKLAQISLGKYDLTSSTSNGHVVVKLISATRQVVAGSLTKMQFEAKESECLKTDENLHSLDSCKVLGNAHSKICTASVWDRPWLENGREITVDCQIDNNTVQEKKNNRSKRSTVNIPGAPIEVDINDPELVKLAQISLGKYDLTSSTSNGHVVVKLISATRQVVAGSLTKMQFEAKESECLKTDENLHSLGSCKVLAAAESKICTANVWDRPWLENGREITVNCQTENVASYKREVHSKKSGSPVVVDINDPKLMMLAQISLKQYDMTEAGTNRHMIVRLVYATKQVVSGYLTKIEFEMRESDCLKSDIDVDTCNALENGENKICTTSVWVRPWLEQDREITIECSSLKSIVRAKKLDMTEADRKFANFIVKYHKKYDSGSDYTKRFKIFMQNLAKIDEMNAKEEGTAVYGINEFADLTPEEFKASHLGLDTTLSRDNAVPMAEAKIPEVADIPVEFDWREQGAVTPVKDQGSCGSCWAFSVTGNVEGQWKIKTGKLLSLSEQELVDCDKLDEGCNGGLPDNAYRAIEQLGGLELETDYPYDAADEQCHFNKSLSRVKISGAVNISSNEDDMLKWLLQHGPISIGINANAMQFYMGGVSHPFKFLCSPDNLDHGVLIVGYGVHKYPLFNKIMPFWIVKNSWGPSWGEKGYYRVYRGDGTCGLNMMASSAVI